MEKAQIGLIGLATMGQNLSRNIANNGYKISVYNRTTEKTEQFIAEYGNEKLQGTKTIEEFIESLAKPRKVMILVKAGKPVDMVIEQITPLLDQDDIIIECGNSYYEDTERRYQAAKEAGLQYLGCGVSGGEEGALNGPSMMPGGDDRTWEQVKEILEAIAAKDFQGGPCVTHIGPRSAGHYVKTVHNGIEYGVMQIMAEAYEIFRSVYQLSAPEIADIFDQYNQGQLQSFLFEIASQMLRKEDELTDDYVIDHILDRAAQKGTGKWTSIDALDRGVGLSTITEAVFARVISSQKEQRVKLSKLYPNKKFEKSIPLEEIIKLVDNALYASMLSSYAQGYDLLHLAAQEENWQLDLGEISRIWEGGCIIRAKILNKLHQAYAGQNNYQHLFSIDQFKEDLLKTTPDLKKVVSFMVQNSLPCSALSTALSYFEAMTSANVSANFIQGLRDFFGAHTYERDDREGHFHTEWFES